MDAVLRNVGSRLRAARSARGLTLAELGEATGISASTLSRLESGGRKPTLELLLPIARELGVALEELVGAPNTGDPRVQLRPVRRFGQVIVPLSRGGGGIQAFKHLIPAGPPGPERPELRAHDGFEWLYVLSGRLRFVLDDQEHVLEAGEVVEFDTRRRHWFGRADDRAVEFLSLFGRQGERLHVRGPGQAPPRPAVE